MSIVIRPNQIKELPRKNIKLMKNEGTIQKEDIIEINIDTSHYFGTSGVFPNINKTYETTFNFKIMLNNERTLGVQFYYHDKENINDEVLQHNGTHSFRLREISLKSSCSLYDSVMEYLNSDINLSLEEYLIKHIEQEIAINYYDYPNTW